MKFALANGQRQEAQPDRSGQCPGCEGPLIAKCGEARIWHWAHKGRQLCDPWWENETKWHRDWKDQFPADWQEIVHLAGDGQRHVADVKTEGGWVIEFQHSYLKPEERRSREAFYPRLIWVVDGMRRKRDRAQLIGAWNKSTPVVKNSPLRKTFAEDCGALREWAGSNVPIFFDLGEGEVPLYLLTSSTNGWAYFYPVPRAAFIEWHRTPATAIARSLDAFVTECPKLIEQYESRPRAQPSSWNPLQPHGFRRRFRL